MLSARSLRTRVVENLANTLGVGPSAWCLSRHAFEAMDRAATMDAADVAHQSYAVHLPRTVWMRGRQRGGQLSHVATDLHVRWLYRLRVEDHDGDYADALDAEARLLETVMRTPSDPELHVDIPEGDGASRRVLPAPTGPYLLGELHFRVMHPHPSR
jgi:hypothetical protein